MNQFEQSEWRNNKCAIEFIENADHYIVERRRLLQIMKHVYHHFIFGKTKRPVQIMDIGCGDGILTQELLKIDAHIEATLIDGSSKMIEQAKIRLKAYTNLNFIKCTLQELIENDLNNTYNLVVSSLAIHHLSMRQKESLFKYIYDHIDLNGLFLNIDTVKAPSYDLEEFYLELWREWISEKEVDHKPDESYRHIPDRYKKNPDNNPDTLKDQLTALKLIGYKNVDCFYKYGPFAVYGGQK